MDILRFIWTVGSLARVNNKKSAMPATWVKNRNKLGQSSVTCKNPQLYIGARIRNVMDTAMHVVDPTMAETDSAHTGHNLKEVALHVQDQTIHNLARARARTTLGAGFMGRPRSH